MDAPASHRSREAPHRRFVPVGPTSIPATARTIAAQALWMALVGTWLELAVLGLHERIVGNVTLATHRFHRYHVPLNLAGHLLIFGAWLAISLPFWRRYRGSRMLDLVIAAEGLFLAAISPMLAIEEFYTPCAVVLAAVLALRFAPWWVRRRGAMMRRTLPVLSAISILFSLGYGGWIYSSESRALAAIPPARPGSPNVLLVVLDTVRADHLSLHGYSRKTTPFLEGLAGRSIVFDFARSPAPWTLPSHASIFTGRWPHELTADVAMPLDGTYPTLAEYLSARGYRTGGFTGNTVYTSTWMGVGRGFSRYEDADENKTVTPREILRATALGRALAPWGVRLGFWKDDGYRASRRRAESLRGDLTRWIDSGRDARPFFGFVNFFDAHDPYIIPEGFPAEFTRETPLEVLRANRLYFHHMEPGGNRALAQEPKRIVMDVYDDCLRYLDAQIAALFDDLARRDRLRDTWVVITADHGEFFGEHDRFGHGSSLYRPVIDIPLMIVPPLGGGVASRRVATPASPRELASTIVDVTGLAEDSPFPGWSLRRFWDSSAGVPTSDEAPLSEMKLPAEHFRDRPSASNLERHNVAVVAEDRILIHNRKGPDELYDVADRSESDDRARRPESAGALQSLRGLLDRLLR